MLPPYDRDLVARAARRVRRSRPREPLDDRALMARRLRRRRAHLGHPLRGFHREAFRSRLGKLTAFLGTSYKRPRPPLSSAPRRGRELRAGVVRPVPVAAHEAEVFRRRASRFDECRHEREDHGTRKDLERGCGRSCYPSCEAGLGTRLYVRSDLSPTSSSDSVSYSVGLLSPRASSRRPSRQAGCARDRRHDRVRRRSSPIR